MYWASCILFHRISEICSTNPILLNVFTIICCIVALYFWPCYHHHYAHKYNIFILCRCQHISHDFILSIEIKEKTDTNEFFIDLHIILNGNWIVAHFCLAPFFFFFVLETVASQKLVHHNPYCLVMKQKETFFFDVISLVLAFFFKQPWIRIWAREKHETQCTFVTWWWW